MPLLRQAGSSNWAVRAHPHPLILLPLPHPHPLPLAHKRPLGLCLLVLG